MKFFTLFFTVALLLSCEKETDFEVSKGDFTLQLNELKRLKTSKGVIYITLYDIGDSRNISCDPTAVHASIFFNVLLENGTALQLNAGIRHCISEAEPSAFYPIKYEDKRYYLKKLDPVRQYETETIEKSEYIATFMITEL